MSIDLNWLTPAPWTADGCDVRGPLNADRCPMMSIYDEGGHSETEAAFIALARNAFDVLIRRGWGVVRFTDGWKVFLSDDWSFLRSACWADPFTALVEADKWYKANVEKK